MAIGQIVGQQPAPATGPVATGQAYAQQIAGGIPFEQVVAPGLQFSPQAPMGLTQAQLDLMSAVFASLAEQQGEEDSALYLTDLVNQEIVARSIKTDIEFTLSPVVQTITAWKNIL